MTAKSPSPSCVKSIPKSLCRVIIFSLASFDESFIELGADGPPVADRSSQAASDPDAAERQQTQNNDIAWSDPRLVEK